MSLRFLQPNKWTLMPTNVENPIWFASAAPRELSVKMSHAESFLLNPLVFSFTFQATAEKELNLTFSCSFETPKQPKHNNTFLFNTGDVSNLT